MPNKKSLVCPYCKQVMPPRIGFPGKPVKQRIYDAVAAHPHGITTEELVTRVYEDDPDGGPASTKIIAVHICNMNKHHLRKNGLQIRGSRGRGAFYKLVTV